ncbi:hypothetical protein BHF71_10800 [Vulcanibacillus modesticaldus]|uniref:Uncharacterized protein n=1 Tax=Vulcanibacillus modesticaldus TaxID=337097 RepID=A0A1D2YT22_9BACI|nr:hypothetical protein [Vulcanibacillus modesticaldus]OEF98831.1 hypothetical protein BHF71_10800 [Vulcanibacillus modesticaldus]
MKFVETNEWDRLHKKFGITPYCREELVIYLSLIWKLVEGKRIFIVPIFNIHEVIKRTGKNYNFVNWQYSVLAEDNKFIDLGFVPAKSSYIVYPKENEFQYKHRKQGIIIEISELQELIDVHNILIFSDAFSEINIFAMNNAVDIHHMLNTLTLSEIPNLEDILKDNDIFIDFVLGVDIGYQDAILIKTKYNLNEQIDSLLTKINNSIREYEGRVTSIMDLSDFEMRLKDLMDL